MSTFKDSTGREWKLTLNFAELKRVRGRIGTDLLNLAEGDPPLIVRLSTDLLFVCDLLFALVEPQALQLGVSDEDFGRQLGPDGAAEAQDALMADLLDFFRRLRRTDLAEMISTQQALIRAGIAAAQAKLKDLDVGRAVAEILGRTFGEPPGSSGSTPAP